VFRYYTNVVSQASRSFASGILTVGLLLTGFGVLIIALPELFAILAAGVFFLIGGGCLVTAAKIFLAQRRLDKLNRPDADYRQNVRIHIDEDDNDF
jgi:hypothetical protein